MGANAGFASFNPVFKRMPEVNHFPRISGRARKPIFFPSPSSDRPRKEPTYAVEAPIPAKPAGKSLGAVRL